MGPPVATCGVKQHVGGLHVSVHQAARVCRVKRGGHLGDDVRDVRRGQLAIPVEQRPQVPPLDVTHRDEQDTAGLAGLEDRDDVGVVNRGRRPRFPHEALAECLVPGEFGRKDLQRDPPVEANVMRTVDDGHPAAADLLLEPVACDQRAGCEVASIARDLVTHPASSVASSVRPARSCARWPPPQRRPAPESSDTYSQSSRSGPSIPNGGYRPQLRRRLKD